jgi:CubicO group peptidase (beta-lactamase class C family)
MAVSASLMMFAACTPAPTPAEKTNEAIKAVMEEFQNVGISAAVVKDGKIVYNESFGYKNLETKEPLGNTDVMRIASISKSFTATALMQLVEKGVISLDGDVSDMIGFKIRNPHHPDVPITLRMVLSHTASIRDKEDYFTLDHLNPAVYGDCEESYFQYKPGEGYNYSNMGLNLAGSILERMSGVRFDDYVRENVIWKLGLYGGHVVVGNNDNLSVLHFVIHGCQFQTWVFPCFQTILDSCSVIVVGGCTPEVRCERCTWSQHEVTINHPIVQITSLFIE